MDMYGGAAASTPYADSEQALREIVQRHADQDWVFTRREWILKHIRIGINKDRLYPLAAKAVFAVTPQMLRHNMVTMWSGILHDALVQGMTYARQYADDLLIPRMALHLGEAHARAGNLRAADAAFAVVDDTLKQDGSYARFVRLMAYMARLRMHSFLHVRYDAEQINRALYAASKLRDYSVKAMLNETLAALYGHRGDDGALSFGYAALGYWATANDPLAYAHAANTVALIYYQRDHFAEAEQVNGAALKRLEHVSDDHAQARLIYMRGIIHTAVQRLPAALSDLWTALHLYTRLNMEYPLLKVHHALGVCYTLMGRFEQADLYLRAAFHEADRLDYHYERANILRSFGYLEGEKGEKRRALRYLEAARHATRRLPPMPLRGDLRRRIRENIRATRAMPDDPLLADSAEG